MGTFRHPFLLLSPDRLRAERVEALVDSGSTFTWVPRDRLMRMGIAAERREEFETVDGRVLEKEMATITVELDGHMGQTLVVFGDEGTEPVIGAYTLEGFLLAVDPVNRRLVPTRGLA